jgi:hypothetical protein
LIQCSVEEEVGHLKCLFIRRDRLGRLLSHVRLVHHATAFLAGPHVC